MYAPVERAYVYAVNMVRSGTRWAHWTRSRMFLMTFRLQQNTSFRTSTQHLKGAQVVAEKMKYCILHGGSHSVCVYSECTTEQQVFHFPRMILLRRDFAINVTPSGE